MSTNAIIKIDGIDFASVYKHWDGYEEATLPWLKHFNETFVNERGVDPDYKFAQLLRSSAMNADKFGLDDSTITGWGIEKGDASAEYVYTLHADGTVSVEHNTEW